MRRMMIAALLAGVALGGCKVQVNDGGKLPEVDVKEKGDGRATVNVKPGEMPDVDVKADPSAVPRVDAPDVKLPEVNAPDVKAPRLDGADTTRRDTARRG
ncbi:MAG TPA: hypothetical protein VFJ82_24135 [Longimicrobium sp.]|nr:hypothetical protein [Longimicrobium sp.]